MLMTYYSDKKIDIFHTPSADQKTTQYVKQQIWKNEKNTRTSVHKRTIKTSYLFIFNGWKLLSIILVKLALETIIRKES